MLSGADLRQALQAGLWKALADDSDHAAMRATCRDARDMADALHDTAVLPVGPGTWDSGDKIAAYHRQLGAVRSVHVRYSGGADGARAAHFMQAYSTALGAPLPAAACSIAVPYGRQLPTPLAAVLLRRVLPHVERLDMALGSYDNVEPLLQALEPCARLCSLRLLPPHAAEGPGHGDQEMRISFEDHPGALEALCRLTRLHTLSGPWAIMAPALQRLCDALPSLTTLGFQWFGLFEASGACISPRLHTLAAWRYSAGHEDMRLDLPWHLSHSNTFFMIVPCRLQTMLPAVRHLGALMLVTNGPRTEDLPAIQAVAQRCAACAERWAWKAVIYNSDSLHVLRGLPPGSLAALKHLAVATTLSPAADVASALGGLVSAAPNITTFAMHCAFRSSPPQALAAVLQPLRRAAHLRTLWLADHDHGHGMPSSTAARQAALLRGVVRSLAQPGAEGGDEHCRALQHVLLHGARPDALAACRAGLARDGISVSVGTCDVCIY